jgi:ferredoxin
VWRELLAFVGIDPRRLQFSWVSAAEGAKWARVVEEVTAEARAVGPFLREAGPAPELPSPEPLRPPDDPAVHDAITRSLRELTARLLREGTVGTAVAYGRSAATGSLVPVLATRAEEAESFVWDGPGPANLAVYLAGSARRPGKVAVLTKSCDALAVAGLLREGQVRRDDLVTIGVRCSGRREADGSLERGCRACEGAPPPSSDWTLADGPPRATGPDPRDAEIAALDGMPAPDRYRYWQAQFARCLRCYACRAACPLCYCASCITERDDPAWVPARVDAWGNTVWNLVRAFHLAGRCAGCNACTHACPAGVRLDLLNRKAAQVVLRDFGHAPQLDPSVPPPLAVFQPQDPGGWIR